MTHRPVLLSLACSLIGCLALAAVDATMVTGVRAADNEAADTARTAPAKRSLASAGQKDDPGASKAALPYDGPPVLDPSRYFGGAAMGYASAKAAPQVMSKIFCYCGCDATDGHKHLIDCFTSNHGMDCHICQEEAVAALKLYRDHTPIAEIQRQIDEEFSHFYPFQEETANYKAYKASRLYTHTADGNQSTGTNAAGPAPLSEDRKNDSGSDTKGKSSGKASKSAGPPKLKPGFHLSSCCSPDTK